MAKRHPSLTAQLKIGRKIELEHGKNPKQAEKIAMDHLKELPDYYTRLVKMEKKGKRELGIKEGAGEAIMSTRRLHKVPLGKPFAPSKSSPSSLLVTKSRLQKEDREELINSIVEYAMVWGAAPPPNPEVQIAKIRKYLSEGMFTRKDRNGFSKREHRKFTRHHTKYTRHVDPRKGHDGVDKIDSLANSDDAAHLRWGSKVGRKYSDWNQKHGERLIDQRFDKPLR